MVSPGVCVVVVGCGAVSAPFSFHFFVSCLPPMWFIVCLVSSLPSAGPCSGDVTVACYDGAMTKFESWVQGSSASSLAAEDPCAFHVLFGDSVEFNFEEGWACSSAAPSLATEVPFAYPVVSKELTENGWVVYVWAMLVACSSCRV